MFDPVLVILNRPSASAPAHDPNGPPLAFVSASSPSLNALDLGATRGDGIFETIGVGGGHPQALEHHLRRFARSAAMLELPPPDLDAWRVAVLAAIDALGPAEESSVKTVLTRGIEGDGRPTGFLVAMRSPDYAAVRREGVRVITLDRGYRHDVEQTSPWLLAGAKSLSYAVNRSVLREAVRRGAEDVIFVSSDGYVLEGPSSSVVFRIGDTILSPGTGLGILEGTTQASIFRYAEMLGFDTGYRLLTVEELGRADAAWLVSSVRLAAPVRQLDGTAFPVDEEFSSGVNSYLKGVRG